MKFAAFPLGEYPFVRTCLGFFELLELPVSMAAKEGAKMAAKGPMSAVCPFPLDGMLCLERPGAVKGAPLLGAAKRTLDGEGKGRRNVARQNGPIARRP